MFKKHIKKIVGTFSAAILIVGAVDASVTKCNEVNLNEQCKIERLQVVDKTVNIPDSATMAFITMNRIEWPANKKATEVVLDLYDGKRWINSYSGFTADGGEVYEDGELITMSAISFPLEKGTGRQARLRVKGEEEIQTRINLTFQ